jgi:hypothetical protein
MKVVTDDIVKAVADSEAVEVNADNKKIRRKDNKALPEKVARDGVKKREAKAGEKEEAKAAKVDEDEVDEKGHLILTLPDFENP